MVTYHFSKLDVYEVYGIKADDYDDAYRKAKEIVADIENVSTLDTSGICTQRLPMIKQFDCMIKVDISSTGAPWEYKR